MHTKLNHQTDALMLSSAKVTKYAKQQ